MTRRASALTAADVAALLRARHPAPEWVFLEQVRNSINAATTRTADAMAFNCWPSRGLELHGFEIKVSRSDWLSELREPAKAEALQRYCDRWWLVAGDDAIVQPGELPPTWGLMVAQGRRGLVAVTEAPKLEAQPLTRGQIASILRSALDVVPQPTALNEVIEAEVEKRVAAAKQLLTRQSLHDEAIQAITEFGKASGIDLLDGAWGWHYGQVGEAVRFLIDHNVTGYGHLRHLATLAETAGKVHRELTAALKAYPAKTAEAA